MGGWGVRGGSGGDDDHMGTQTPRTVSAQAPFYRYLQYFRDGGPSYRMMVDDGDDGDDGDDDDDA